MGNGSALIAALRGMSGTGTAAPAAQPQQPFQTLSYPWQTNAPARETSFVAPVPQKYFGPSIAELRNARTAARAVVPQPNPVQDDPFAASVNDEEDKADAMTRYMLRGFF